MVVGWWQEWFYQWRIAAQQAMCGLVHYHDAETTVHCSCHLPLCFLWTTSRSFSKTCTKKWPVTLCPVYMKSRCTKFLMSKNSVNILTFPHIPAAKTRIWARRKKETDFK
jgi:hypothetical protein